MNDQEDSEENKTELLKMIITIFEIIFKNLSGDTEIVNLIPLKRELLEVQRSMENVAENLKRNIEREVI